MYKLNQVETQSLKAPEFNPTLEAYQVTKTAFKGLLSNGSTCTAYSEEFWKVMDVADKEVPMVGASRLLVYGPSDWSREPYSPGRQIWLYGPYRPSSVGFFHRTPYKGCCLHHSRGGSLD
jgi:hypothetical protein